MRKDRQKVHEQMNDETQNDNISTQTYHNHPTHKEVSKQSTKKDDHTEGKQERYTERRNPRNTDMTNTQINNTHKHK